jgi:hypothetical protein
VDERRARARGRRATSPEWTGTATSIAANVAVKFQGRFSTPSADPHLLPQGAKGVGAREQQEERREGPEGRRHLAGAHVHEPRERRARGAESDTARELRTGAPAREGPVASPTGERDGGRRRGEDAGVKPEPRDAAPARRDCPAASRIPPPPP